MRWIIAMLFVAFTISAADKLSPEKVNTIIEALSRLDPEVVKSNAALKTALKQVLNATRGEPRFVDLVKKFRVKNRETDLLLLVVKHPNDPAGVEALGMVLAGNGKKAVAAMLTGKDAKQAAAVAKALGNSNNQSVIPLLMPLVTDAKLHVNVCKEAVKGLANSKEGAQLLLGLAKKGKLPQNVKFTASLALSMARWPAIKAEAAKVLPPPFGANAKPLPPVAELAKRKGNIANGAKVFFARSSCVCALSSGGRKGIGSGAGAH